MVDKLLQQKIYPYDGEQDSTKNPLLISPKDIIGSNNIVYTSYSTKKKRPGLRHAFDEFRTAGRRVLGSVDYWRLGVQRVVIWDGKFLKAINPANGIVDNITGDHVLPTDETVTFSKFYGYLIIFFGGGATQVKAWNGSGTITNLSVSEPKAAFGRIWLNKLWLPDTTIRGRLLHSKTSDPTDFVGADAGHVDCDINAGDPDGMTAIFPPFFGSLYVTKRLSTYKITPVRFAADSIAYPAIKISGGTGCISHNGVIAVEDNIFFPSDRGIHQFETTDKISEIATALPSRNIQPDWVGGTNFKRSDYIQAVYDSSLDSLIWLYPSSSHNYPTNAWGFSYVAKKWYMWENYNQTSICQYVEVNTKRLRTLVGGSDGNIGIIDENTKSDYGKKISCSFQSGIIAPGGSPNNEFQYCYISPIFVPQVTGKFVIKIRINGRIVEDLTFNMEDTSLGDELGDDFILSDSYLGGVPRVKIDTRRINGSGMLYQLLISHEQSSDEEDVGFELLGILMDVDSDASKTGKGVA